MPTPYGLNALNEFILTIIMSSKVKGTKPLSSLIVGLPDTGKTEIVLQYKDVKKVDIESDLTAFGLSTLLPKIQNGEVKTIVIPDLARITEGRGRATEGLIAALNSLIEEGVLNIKTFNIRFTSEKPVRCNAIACLTIKSFEKDKGRWGNLGFLSRTVPFFLAYCQEDMDKSLNDIKEGVNPFVKKTGINLDSQTVVQITHEQKTQIEKIARFIAKINADYTAFRSFKNLITLAKAHAVAMDRKEVIEEDIRFLIALMPFWFNPHGDDSQYYVVKNLPATRNELYEKLNEQYTHNTIDYAVESLKAKQIITDRDGILLVGQMES